MPYIKFAQYNAEMKAIQFNITYGGGCHEQKFQLQIGSCIETFPVQCKEAQLIELVKDGCEALLLQQLTIGLHQAGLDTEYYRGALIHIHGDEGSKVIVELPR